MIGMFRNRKGSSFRSSCSMINEWQLIYDNHPDSFSRLTWASRDSRHVTLSNLGCSKRRSRPTLFLGAVKSMMASVWLIYFWTTSPFSINIFSFNRYINRLIPIDFFLSLTMIQRGRPRSLAVNFCGTRNHSWFHYNKLKNQEHLIKISYQQEHVKK